MRCTRSTIRRSRSDGDWVAYVRTADLVKDKRITHIWMTSWDGDRARCSSRSPRRASTRRAGADGKYLSFLTARGGGEEPEQVWLLDRTGGEQASLQRRRRRLRVVARRPQARADRCRRRSAQRRRRGGQDPAADRHRSLLLQGRQDRLPRHQRQHLCVRRREPQSGNRRQALRRGLAGVVARRQADRLLQQARRGSGSQRRVRPAQLAHNRRDAASC